VGHARALGIFEPERGATGVNAPASHSLGRAFRYCRPFGLINRGETSPRASVAGWVAKNLAARFAATARAADRLLLVILCLRGGDLFKGKSKLASCARKQRSSSY
jgi:hypothetical protein